MATIKAKYVEPRSYFNDAMKKADKEWDRKEAAKEKAAKKSSGKKK